MGKPSAVRLREVGYYRPNVDDVGAEQRRVILQLADEICQGRIPFLSYGTQELGLKPAWNRDFVAGKEWTWEASQSLATVRFDGSDVKVPWELSRMQFLSVLGKAFWLTREPVYRQTARQYVEDWIERNPVGYGVNWMVAMEAALRAVSVLLLVDLLSPMAPEEKAWEEMVARSMWQHLLFIEGHLEFSYLVRGNHYLSNLLGLYALSVFLDGPGMEARRERYRRLLQREILFQTYADGGDYEASSGYHMLVTQMFLSAYWLMRAEGAVPAQSFVERLRKMFEWMEALADSQGRLPHVGDCDDGRVEFLHDDLMQMAWLPLEKRDSLRVRHFLRLGKAMLDERACGAADGPWYGLEPDCCDHARTPALPARMRQVVLRDSGIAVAGCGNNDLVFLAVPNGIGGKGTHTHNDKLSVILRLAGEEVLCDPGTGCYTRDGAMRDRFRSTAAHNTVMIDGNEQNRIPNARMNFFSLGNDVQMSKIKAEMGVTACRLEAALLGQACKGVVHTRIVEWTGVNSVQVEDRFSGNGLHQLQSTFQVAPGWKISGVREEAGRACCDLEGSCRVSLTFSADGALRVWQEDSAISWIYGTIVASTSIRIDIKAQLPASLYTNLRWDE